MKWRTRPEHDAIPPRLPLPQSLRPIGLALLAFLVAGCVDDADDTDGLPTGTQTGPPVAARYGAIGNSLTAGFINGALLEGGQRASYPIRIAAQAGWTTPQLPIVASPGISSTLGLGGIFVTETGGLETRPWGVPDPRQLLRNPLLPRPYDNLGVPGATTKDLLDATNAATSQRGNNLFFDLILRNSALPPGNWTVLDATEARNPNAISLWIGSNDILGGALGGEPEVGVNITPPAVFEQLYLGVMARLDRMNAKHVAVANVPSVVDIPYVTTIPPAFPAGPDIFVPFNTAEENVRFVLLPFGLLAASNPDTLATYLQGFGTNVLPPNWTLDAEEVALIEATTDAYNAVIAREVAARGWGYVDARAELAALPHSVLQPQFDVVNGLFPWFPLFGTGGISFFWNKLSVFSLDGVHSSELGSALVANAFIRAFNDAYDLGIPTIDLATVQNEVGYENAPEGAPRPIAGSAVDEGTIRLVQELPHRLGIGQ